jgi:Capsule polysaccharide biosynthesis protein
VSALGDSDWRQRLRDLGNAYGRRPNTLADRVAGRVRRPLDRLYLRRVGRLPDHAALGRSAVPLRPPVAGPRVLVLALRSWVTHAAYEAVIAHALRLRGCEVALVTCGGGQPACEMGWARTAHPRPCDRCGWFTDVAGRSSGLPRYRLVDRFDWSDAPSAPRDAGSDEARAAAAISIPWFMQSSNPDAVGNGADAARDFTVAADADLHAFAEIFDDFRPDVVFMVSGLFASERAAWRVARERGVPVVTYEMAPHGPGIVFARDAAAPEYPSDAAWAELRDTALTSDEERELDALLEGRARNIGTHDIEFEEAGTTLRTRLGIPDEAQIAGLFTNITYDSAALFKDVAFDSMVDWVGASVMAARDTATHLVIRVHPGEARWGTNEPVEKLVRARVGELPENVHIIPSGSQLNSYDLLRESDVVFAYTSTVGLEAAARGIPASTAGICHYRGKGFTADIAERDDLARLLATPPVMSDEQRDLARRYAHLFFVRMMIPFPAVDSAGLRTNAMVSDAAELMPGENEWVDFVCERIVGGGAFLR